jgi:hypothetical protein
LEALPAPRNRVEFFEGLFLPGKIGLEIHMRRVNTFMTEPQGNGRDVDARLDLQEGSFHEKVGKIKDDVASSASCA